MIGKECNPHFIGPWPTCLAGHACTDPSSGGIANCSPMTFAPESRIENARPPFQSVTDATAEVRSVCAADLMQVDHSLKGVHLNANVPLPVIPGVSILWAQMWGRVGNVRNHLARPWSEWSECALLHIFTDACIEMQAFENIQHSFSFHLSNTQSMMYT